MTAARLAVPAYFHPAVAAADWAVLGGSAHPPHTVVLNVDSGPGYGPVPALVQIARRLVERGVSLLGYIDTGYGSRPQRLVRSDLGRYRSWYPVAGAFLDRVSSGAKLLPWYDRLTARARALGAGTVVLNHGTYPDHRYGGLADALVTFEGPWTAYRGLCPPDWVHDYAADRFWHLVYATPRRRLDAALRRATACNTGTVYVTDRAGANPWDALAGYFEYESRVWTRP